jgi:small subunit ribosomal protein S6
LIDPSLVGPAHRPVQQATMTQPYYETMYILRPDIPEEEVETHITRYRDLVIEAGGEVLDCQMRGKRRLAYPIAKHREGIYVQLNHNGDGQQVAPLERAMRLSEDVIRYLTVKQDGPMPPPRSVPAGVGGAGQEESQPA